MEILERAAPVPRLHAVLNAKRENMAIVDNAGWDIYRSSFRNYRKSFGQYFTEADMEALKAKPAPVVIDFMGPTDATADLLGELPQTDKLGIAVEFKDRRRILRRFRDWMLNVHQIKGDITESSTWQKVDAKLNGRKADLIMERAIGGLAHIPTNKRLYEILISKAWERLSEQDGIMLLHFPSYGLIRSAGITDAEAASWVAKLNSSNIPTTIGQSTNEDNNILKIVKTPNSPALLPSI